MKKKLEHMCKRIPYINKTRVGLLSSITLKFTGMMDAENNLVTKDSNGVWSSPFSKSEADEYTAVADKLWEILHKYHKESYVKMQESYTAFLKLQKQISEYKTYLSDLEMQYKGAELQRKPGDESLSDAQVRNRRHSEATKALADKRRQLSSLETKLLSEQNQLAALYARTAEDIGFIRLKQQAAQVYFCQCSDVYWKSVIKSTPAEREKPVQPAIVFSQMKNLYMESHSDILSKVKNIIMEGEDENV